MKGKLYIIQSVPSCQYQDKEMSYRFAKEQGQNNLTHFKITELQKLQVSYSHFEIPCNLTTHVSLQHPVLLKVTINYSYETTHHQPRTKEHVISYELPEAPLYARTVNEMRKL